MDSNSINNNEPQQNAVKSVSKFKRSKSNTFIGIICGIMGFAIGGLGIFVILKMINSNIAKDCPDCTCPKCAKVSSGFDAVNTGFLTLETNSQNLIYSPLSIRYGLSLLRAGADGTTETEITNLIGTDELPEYKNIQDKLSLANAVFIRDTYSDKVLSSYADAVTNDYDSEIIYDAFTGTDKMDEWVSKKTFKLIDKIGINITSDTRMVLANALAIQLDWQHQFDSDNTHGRAFFKADGSEVSATSMNITTHAEDINYYMDDNITLVSMPLEATEDSALEFVAVMPSSDLSGYIENFSVASVEDALNNATSASTPKDGVELYIPKFKFEYKLDFIKDLQSLGINSAFSGSADFSKMTNSVDGLFVSDAVHKANIDFSEDGIKASAVTAFAMSEGAALVEEVPRPVVIKIDHPFLFLIRDKNNGAVWFIGTVYEPNIWENDKASYYE